MRILNRSLLAAAAFAAAVACASVEEVLPIGQKLPAGPGDNAPVTFSASVGITSKTAIDDERKVSWATGDKITVFDSQGRSEEFVVEKDCDSYSFTSTGIIGKGPYYAVAGYGQEVPSFDKDTKRIGIARPSATADGSFGEADLVASMTSGTSFTFHHVFALLKMSIGSDDITSLTFSAEGITASTGTQIGFDSNGAIDAEYNYGGNEISVEGITGPGTYYIAVNPGTYDRGVTIYLKKGPVRMKVSSDKAFTASVNGIVNFGTLDDGTSGPQMTEVNAFMDEIALGVYSYDAVNDVVSSIYQYCAGSDQFAVSDTEFRLQNLAEGHMAGVTLPSDAVVGNSYPVDIKLYGIDGYSDGKYEKVLVARKTENGKIWLLEEDGTLGFIIHTR